MGGVALGFGFGLGLGDVTGGVTTGRSVFWAVAMASIGTKAISKSTKIKTNTWLFERLLVVLI